MANDITIRLHRASDRNDILNLLRLNTPDYFSPDEEQDLLYYLDDHSDHYYVVETDNVIQGCGGFNVMVDGLTVRLSWDIIHPQSQGKGLGSALTKFRIQQIQQLVGVKTIEVRTSQFVYPFYERFGFELREIVKDYWAAGFDLYRLDRAVRSVNP
ncbi:GNAT family N-acetyltransferase [Spirosoma taeanense]|uniref:GNAT family N-acetyltransferase n=2 Tax=Spirosoma taeanense TaxID=2735870 RepID=A0A6M5YFC0_9BACT|nr:GNAT family N-acetyltransferase [Spirosoma taeanense]